MEMRNLLFICLTLLMIGCKNEEVLVPNIQHEDLYTIKDDPSDPIKHRIYELYQHYKVPIYFNDTIARVLVTTDVQGKPLYNYELIDLAWGFDNYENRRIVYDFVKDSAQKTKALDIIEAFLKKADKSLYPFSFLVVDRVRKFLDAEVKEEYASGKYNIGFRTVVLTTNWTSTVAAGLPDDLMRQMLLNKIINYPDDIAAFGVVSKATHYGGKFWNALNPAIAKSYNINSLYDNWPQGIALTPAQREARRAADRAVAGQFGFVSGNFYVRGLGTPENVDEDLQSFIVEMLRFPSGVFEQNWGTYPLVMKKYKILLNVTNKLGVKL